MQFTYLLVLIVSIVCVWLTDFRYKLVFTKDKSAAFRSVAAGFVFMLVWDLTGIHAGIFFEGESKYMTGLMVLPHLPIEEFFFLTLLVYTPLVVYEFARGRHV